MMRSHSLAVAPPPPPEMIDDAIAEILFRLPPDDPACLVRASLVCKLWHRILSEPTFPDRYREFHGTPPLLGFLSGSYTIGHDESAGRFVPIATRKIPFQEPEFGRRALDCRHGRLLLKKVDGTGRSRIREDLAVWNPVTSDHKVLSSPEPESDLFPYSGAVLCATAACNHRAGCHGSGPFHVVFVRITPYYGTIATARAWVYSSQAATWSAPASVHIQYPRYYHPMVARKRAAIVGDQLFFLLSPGFGILKYDLRERCLTVIGSPCTYTCTNPGILMTMEDGSLGFIVSVNDDDCSTLQLWRATKVNPNGSMGWVHDRVISPNNLLPTLWSNQVVNVVGFAEGVDILFLSVGETGRGIMFELKSGRIRKLSNPEYFYYDDYFPYLSFYIPDFASHK